MSSYTYIGGEDREYPTLGITAQHGQDYDLPAGAEVPTDGRWSVDGNPIPAPVPGIVPQADPEAATAVAPEAAVWPEAAPAPAPAPEPVTEPVPAPAAATTIGD